MTDGACSVSRRSVLRNSAVAAGAVAAGGAATGTAAGRIARSASSSGSSDKRGGRAQVDGEVERHEPFTLEFQGTDTRNATCMSGESAQQVYLVYDIEYCESGSEAEMYVIPDEAELAEQEVYAIRSARPCRENDLLKVAFGPANEEC